MSNTQLQTATFAGGCFWCTEAVFQRLKGVTEVVPGYAGGTTENPRYEDIHNNDTGHVEAIQVSFDPSVVSYEKLLDVFWHTHNPTTLNKQGYDVGEEYRSVIFYHDEKQQQIAEASKHKTDESGKYEDPIVTEIVPYTNFYKAEQNHQEYYNTHRSAPYCTAIIDPKIRKLMKDYAGDVKEEYKES